MSAMETSMSVIRFLMFIIFIVIILFKILTMKYSGDKEEDEPAEVSYENSEKNSDGDDDDEVATDDENDSADTFSYINKDDDKGEKSGQVNKSSTTNSQWEKALKYEKNDNEEYQYTSDDIDKLTLMSSDDMIFCLKNDNTCSKMEFEKCQKTHIGTYMDENSCLNAKTVMSTKEYCLENGSCNAINKSDSCSSKIRYATKEKCEDANITYCNIDGKCAQKYSDVSCSNTNTYNTMNECKAGESLTQDEGEYCLYEDACNTISTGETCKGRLYTSLEMCKKNNIQYCLNDNNQCEEIQKNDPCSNRFFDIKCENTTKTVII